MPIETKRFRTWGEFKGEFNNFLPMRTASRSSYIYTKYIFRGQMEADWGLLSSFDRISPNEISNRNLEYAKWNDFFVSLHEKLGRPLLEKGENEVEALAQHYGVSTRLLDFSLSPYVAAFFAFFDALRFGRTSSRDVAIWTIHVPSFSLASRDGFTIAAVKGASNVRVRNQLGKFLRNDSQYECVEDYIEKKAPHLANSMCKFCLPVSEAVAALNDLVLMGISPIEIYPDHEGIAMYVRLRQLLEGYGAK